MHAALISAFDNESLAQFVKFSLDEDLDKISSGKNFTAKAFDVISWAEAQGKLEELVRLAKLTVPDNRQLRTLTPSSVSTKPQIDYEFIHSDGSEVVEKFRTVDWRLDSVTAKVNELYSAIAGDTRNTGLLHQVTSLKNEFHVLRKDFEKMRSEFESFRSEVHRLHDEFSSVPHQQGWVSRIAVGAVFTIIAVAALISAWGVLYG